MGRQKRQCVQSSHVWDMVANGEGEADIVQALQPNVIAALPAALAAARAERAPAEQWELAPVITQFTGLVGQNWSDGGREEFLGLALSDLGELPGAMTLAAVKDARRHVNDGRHLVTWVYQRIEKKLARLDAEVARLEYLNGLLPKV